MAVSYNKLWKLLVDKKMSKADLRKAAEIAPNTMTKLRRDEPVTLANPRAVPFCRTYLMKLFQDGTSKNRLRYFTSLHLCTHILLSVYPLTSHKALVPLYGQIHFKAAPKQRAA